VRVEALAPRLGASKGSFYWHYADRPALVDAALALWEERETVEVLRPIQAIADPQERLRAFFERAFAEPARVAVDTALATDAADAQVAPVVQRVSRKRLKLLRDTFVDLGFEKDAAAQRSLAGYTAYLGLIALRREVPRAVPSSRAARQTHLDMQLKLLTTR
jgi:AcrR family transcriptional regulator